MQFYCDTKMKFQVAGFSFPMRFQSKIENRRSQIAGGFTLFELVITLTVLAILVMGTIPLAQNGARRQKELRLRESLRMMRNAIDEFKRDTTGACLAGASRSGNGTIPGGILTDARSRVVIDDCEIFDTLNLDRYPPTLETLADGVKVKQRGLNIVAASAFDDKNQATELNSEANELKKVYLREIPVDPMTGEKVWKFRSSYQAKDDDSWDDINVFDVSSTSEEEALNGEKYSEW